MLKDLDKQFSLVPPEAPGKALSNVRGTTARLGTRELTLFSTDDFLGYAQDERLFGTVLRAIELDGLGPAATPDAGGVRECHRRLEGRLSALHQSPDTVIFPSSAAAWRAFTDVCASDSDVIFYDHLCQPVIVDALRSCSARVSAFPHLHLDTLERLLEQHTQARRKFIVIESVSGVTGAIAPLTELYELATEFEAHLVVDETFAAGVLGSSGAGGVEQCGLVGKEITQIYSFDRALAGIGAALSTEQTLCDLIRKSAKTYLDRVPLPPAVVYQVEAAVELAAGDVTKRSKLLHHAQYVAATLAEIGFRLASPGKTPIIPILLENEDHRAQFVHALLDRGIFVSQVRPTANPGPSAALRLTVSALHTADQIATLLQGFAEISKRTIKK